jgi:hypothetical protein
MSEPIFGLQTQFVGDVRFGPEADMVRLFEKKTLFAIVKMGQILFIFCARDHAAFLLNPGAVFSR